MSFVTVSGLQFCVLAIIICSSKLLSLLSFLLDLQYVIRDGTKATSGKDKSAYILMPRREGQQLPERIGSTTLASGTGVTEDENGILEQPHS